MKNGRGLFSSGETGGGWYISENESTPKGVSSYLSNSPYDILLSFKHRAQVQITSVFRVFTSERFCTLSVGFIYFTNSDVILFLS